MSALKNGALYIRVSTADQTELSPDAQQRLLLDYAKKNGIVIAKEFIFEESVSGRHADRRPKFQEMIALAKQDSHPIDVILVWKYSRFARNQEESIVYKSLLKKNNIDVISISEPLIDGPFGTLIERGLLKPGTELTDEKGKFRAKVGIDGHLEMKTKTGTQRASIHKMGALVQNAPSCNGWTYWHIQQRGKSVPIDSLRQVIRDEMARA